MDLTFAGGRGKMPADSDGDKAFGRHCAPRRDGTPGGIML
jgi:hypothetical protein